MPLKLHMLRKNMRTEPGSLFRVAATSLCVLCLLSLTALSVSCGDDKKDDKGAANGGNTPAPAPQPSPAPTPQPTSVPESAPVGFWAASASQRVVSRFDAGGASTAVLDFQPYLQVGGITALGFLSAAAGGGLVALLDQQTDSAAEFLARIDTQSGSIKTPYWYLDNANLTGLDTHTILGDTLASNLLIHTPTGVERLILGQAAAPNRISGAGGTGPWIPSLGTTGLGCRSLTIVSIATVVNAEKRFLMINSTGSGAYNLNVINELDTSPACLSTHDYSAADLPTTAADVPINALQMPNGKIYVLYANATAPKIVSYDFDGTNLANPTVVFADAAVLGATPRGLAARTNRNLLFGNAANGTVYEVTIEGELTGFFVQSAFLVGVSSLISQL